MHTEQAASCSRDSSLSHQPEKWETLWLRFYCGCWGVFWIVRETTCFKCIQWFLGGDLGCRIWGVVFHTFTHLDIVFHISDWLVPYLYNMQLATRLQAGSPMPNTCVAVTTVYVTDTHIHKHRMKWNADCSHGIWEFLWGGFFYSFRSSFKSKLWKLTESMFSPTSFYLITCS